MFIYFLSKRKREKKRERRKRMDRRGEIRVKEMSPYFSRGILNFQGINRTINTVLDNYVSAKMAFCIKWYGTLQIKVH